MSRGERALSQTMKGKVVVITGATSGIGEVAARELAGMGARIVLVARDVSRGEAVLAQLRGINPGVKHFAHYADLSLLSEMKKVSREIAAAQPRIDVQQCRGAIWVATGHRRPVGANLCDQSHGVLRADARIA